MKFTQKCAWCKKLLEVEITGARIIPNASTATILCEDAVECLERQHPTTSSVNRGHETP